MSQKSVEPRVALIPTPSLDPKSHGAVRAAVEMTLVHNCLIRAVNSIYYHAPYVTTTKDIRDFLHFCAIFVEVTLHHHDGEETYIFPPWAEQTNCPALLKENHAEHRLFHHGFEQLSRYAKTTDPSAYKSEDLLAILEDFTDPLAAHLTNEIDSILRMQEYSSEVAKKIFKEGVQKSMEGADKADHLPFLFGTHDKTFEGGKHYFPPVGFLLNAALMFWYGSKNAGAWRFCPSDLYSRPRKPTLGPNAA
ncbi:uncharacterized protein AB675_10915 [Cyphellophora attinorum]|uniref:Hemerythrin-like domain-containing protein n=1 Tax=Cyphellophora attinorum TaxID=1664694 RepID=A0A0N1GY54_9EURO|nr:uncharacterized protein AB675_10915 [Phialophora attinorum]KPI35470.1 hypothetical protein AB675_10915 [Phialophora attinorum]